MSVITLQPGDVVLVAGTARTPAHTVRLLTVDEQRAIVRRIAEALR